MKKNTTYTEYRKSRQEEFNKLPIFFAFSNEQFRNAMEERGLKESDTCKICSIGNGGFCLKSDLPLIKAFIDTPDPVIDLMDDDTFAEDAFYYEMCNHEYGINWQADFDVCSCFVLCEYGEDKDFCDYLEEAGHGEWKTAYRQARRKYFADAEENDWF